MANSNEKQKAKFRELRPKGDELRRKEGPKPQREEPEQESYIDTATPEPSKLSPSDHLEHLARSYVETINVRRFSKTDPPWTFVDTEVFGATFDPVNNINLDAYLEVLERITTIHPTHHIHVEHAEVYIDEDAKRGSVYLTVKTAGVPDVGLVTEGVGILEFAEKEGEWWCVSYTGVREFLTESTRTAVKILGC